jgi:hypothetical protein
VRGPFRDYVMLQTNYQNRDVAIRSVDSLNKIRNLFQLEWYDDKGISHMGQLINSADGSSFFYIPYYNSRIIHYNYLSKTIAEIQTIEKTSVQDRSVSTFYGRILSSKMPVINRKGAANSKWLFVLSYAVSEHDTNPDMTVVDVYSIPTKKYAYSFQIPQLMKKEVRGFACTDSNLVISSDKKIIFYAFNQ